MSAEESSKRLSREPDGQKIVYAGRYVLETEIGAGGMGRVFRARDLKLQRVVALKVLQPDRHDERQRLRFEQEARAAGALNHPNILAVHDAGEQRGEPYIVSELLEGETLGARLSRGALRNEETIAIGLQIATGLAAAHEKGIVHRDLKPENVFLTRDGPVKIVDFGIAKLLPSGGGTLTEGESSPHTATGSMVGTVAYMSPEQVRGQPVDARTDLFSLGTVLYEMATGGRPFSGNTPMDTALAILHDDPRPLPESVAPELRRVIDRCLMKEAPSRFAAARDVIDELSRTPAKTPPRRARKVVLVLAIAASLAATFWLAGPHQQKGAPIASSIAVLPFRDLSAARDQEHFSDGIAEEILVALAGIEGLRVVGRTSSFSLRNSGDDLRVIGRKLDAAALLEGSVRKSGQRVRVAAQLVNANDGYQLWAQEYERDVGDVFAVQDEIARAVVAALRPRLLKGQNPSASKHGTRSAAAHEAYLQGRYHLAKYTWDDIQKAIGFFEQALRADASYASAYVGISDSYSALTDYYLAPAETMPKARAAAEKALQLDDTLAEAHAALGWVKFTYDWQWTPAENEFRRAIELNPSLPVAHDALGQYFAALGRPDEAMPEIHRALELEPLSTIFMANATNDLFSLRRYDESIEQGRKALDLEPNYWVARMYLSFSLAQTGKPAEAVAVLEKSWPGDSPLLLVSLAAAYGHANRVPEARRALAEVMDISRKRYLCPYELAAAYVAVGDRDEALRLLGKAFDERSICMVWMKTDARLDPLRSEARFKQVMDGMRFPP